MVSGKLGAPTSNGFEVEEAGLQVFKEKPKEPKQTEENAEAIALEHKELDQWKRG
ncbi:MAG: hypothetical protein AB4426_17270 [Xenococcaceae cyanobacterium]